MRLHRVKLHRETNFFGFAKLHGVPPKWVNHALLPINAGSKHYISTQNLFVPKGDQRLLSMLWIYLTGISIITRVFFFFSNFWVTVMSFLLVLFLYWTKTTYCIIRPNCNLFTKLHFQIEITHWNPSLLPLSSLLSHSPLFLSFSFATLGLFLRFSWSCAQGFLSCHSWLLHLYQLNLISLNLILLLQTPSCISSYWSTTKFY